MAERKMSDVAPVFAPKTEISSQEDSPFRSWDTYVDRILRTLHGRP